MNEPRSSYIPIILINNDSHLYAISFNTKISAFNTKNVLFTLFLPYSRVNPNRKLTEAHNTVPAAKNCLISYFIILPYSWWRGAGIDPSTNFKSFIIQKFWKKNLKRGRNSYSETVLHANSCSTSNCISLFRSFFSQFLQSFTCTLGGGGLKTQ